MKTFSYTIAVDPMNPTMNLLTLDGERVCGAVSHPATAKKIACGHYAGLLRALGLRAGFSAEFAINDSGAVFPKVSAATHIRSL